MPMFLKPCHLRNTLAIDYDTMITRKLFATSEENTRESLKSITQFMFRKDKQVSYFSIKMISMSKNSYF